MKTCETCKHWRRGSGVPGTKDTRKPCMKISSRQDVAEKLITEKELENAPAIIDGVDIDAPFLNTEPDFGCTLHESK